jgi:hypothetical protein
MCLIANDLQLKRPCFSVVKATKIATTVFCLALVLLLSLLAANQSLHRLIHKDADDAGHECAVTLYAHGQVLHSLPELISALVVLGFVWLMVLPKSVIPSPRAFVFPPGRGPPVCLP